MSQPNPLCQLNGAGQSVWLDQLRREWLQDGTMQKFIADDCVRGVTSNPSIFEQALADSTAYDEQLRGLVAEGYGPADVYDELTVSDIRAACDLFLPLWRETDGADGYVSHEVSPDLAYDTQATIDEAARLWREVDRPNVMIKIPATNEGIPAVRRSLIDGINVNITLMFSLAHYDAIVEAYLEALEERFSVGLPLAGLHSVASFFVSRVDTLVDRRLDALTADGVAEAAALRGEAAVANAKRAWRRSREVFSGSRFGRLARHGAGVQRVLWASTSAKDPAYRDVRYVEPLIGADTINTMPLGTLEAFRDHGHVAETIDKDMEHADEVVRTLAAQGIDLIAVGQQLSREGVAAFQKSQDGVMQTVRTKVESTVGV